MGKRKHTKKEAIGMEIQTLRASGKTRREIADHLGLEVQQIKWWIIRYNRKQAAMAKGIVPRP